MKTISLIYFDFIDQSFLSSLKRKKINLSVSLFDDDKDLNGVNFDSDAILFVLPRTGFYEPVEILQSMKTKTNSVIFVFDHDYDFRRRLLYTQIGADLYFTFPVHTEEILKYISFYSYGKHSSEDHQVSYKDITIDMNRRSVTRGNDFFYLRNKEFDLLFFLIQNHGIVVSKRKILEEVWDMNANTDTKTLETHISVLRNKIDRKFDEKRLHTMHCIGYKLE